MSDAAEQTVMPAPHVRATGPERIVALVIGVVAAIGFVSLRVVVGMNGLDPLPMDLWWQGVLGDDRVDALVVLAWIPGIGGGTIAMIVLVIVLVLVFWLRGRRWDAVNIGSAVAVVVAIGAPLSYVIARARPDASLAESLDTSFPSGHTAVATTITLTLALLLRRWYLWTLAAVWVLWMAWSRTYLSAHWLSDVLAGICEGIAVATLVWVAVEAVRDRRARAHLSDPDRPGELPADVR